MKSNLLQDQRVRYVLTGGGSFVAEYGVFAALTVLHAGLFVANSVSFLIGLLTSFWIHKIWSFAGEHTRKTHHQFIGYLLLATCNLFLTNMLIGLMVHTLSVPALIAKVLTIGSMVLWNYFLLSKLFK